MKIAVILALSFSLASCIKELSESRMDSTVGYNGSFEKVKDGLPVNWLVYTTETTEEGDFNIELDSSTMMEGKQSLKFSVNSCSSQGGWYSPGIAQEITVEAGGTYLIRFFLKNEGANFSVKIGSVSAFEKHSGPQLTTSETMSEWTKHEYTYQVPEGMERLRFELNVLSKGTLWIDNIEISKTKNLDKMEGSIS